MRTLLRQRDQARCSQLGGRAVGDGAAVEPGDVVMLEDAAPVRSEGLAAPWGSASETGVES